MIHLRDPDRGTVTDTVTTIIEGVRNRAELARTLGINRAQIYKWLEGKEPSLPELSGLAHATGTPIRIDLGPVPPEPIMPEDRIELVERQIAIVMQTALTNQEAIMRLLAQNPPSSL